MASIPYPPCEVGIAGLTPNGVRTDIIDKPATPHVAPSPSVMPRKPKPWEQDGNSNGPGLQGALHAVSTMQEVSPPAPMITEVSAEHCDPKMRYGSDGKSATQETSTNVRRQDFQQNLEP